MKTLRDPIVIAKFVGALLIIRGILLLIAQASNVIAFVNILGSIIIGIGLFDGKKWGIYGLMTLALLVFVVEVSFILSGAEINYVGTIATILFYLACSIWFYSARNRFK